MKRLAVVTLMLSAGLAAGCASTVEPTNGRTVVGGGVGAIAPAGPSGSLGSGASTGQATTASGTRVANDAGHSGSTGSVGNSAQPSTSYSSTTTRSANGGKGTTTGVGTSRQGGGASSPATAEPSSSTGASALHGEVKIGFPYPDDFGSLYSTLGIKSYSDSPEDFENQVNVMLAYANAHGGFHGEKAVPVYYLYKFDTGGTFSEEMQQMCTYFTEDNPVFAVGFLYGNAYDPLPQCLAEHHTVLFNDTNSEFYDDQQLAALGPYYYRPFQASLWAAKAQIEGLAKFGFFKGNVKIGVLRWGDTQGNATYKNLVAPTFARLGLKITDEFAYAPANSAADAAQFEEETSSAELHFRTDGITRVVTIGSNSSFPYLFATDAANQDYYPRIGMSTMDLPGFMPGNAPASELSGMEAIGWNRIFDLDFNGPTAGTQQIPQFKQCKAIFNAAHLPATSNGYYCSKIFWLQDALNRAPSLTADGMRIGVDRIGTSFHAAGTFDLDFHAGDDDGIAAARLVTYSAKCKCMVYSSPPFKISH